MSNLCECIIPFSQFVWLVIYSSSLIFVSTIFFPVASFMWVVYLIYLIYVNNLFQLWTLYEWSIPVAKSMIDLCQWFNVYTILVSTIL